MCMHSETNSRDEEPSEHLAVLKLSRCLVGADEKVHTSKWSPRRRSFLAAVKNVVGAIVRAADPRVWEYLSERSARETLNLCAFHVVGRVECVFVTWRIRANPSEPINSRRFTYRTEPTLQSPCRGIRDSSRWFALENLWFISRFSAVGDFRRRISSCLCL